LSSTPVRGSRYWIAHRGITGNNKPDRKRQEHGWIRVLCKPKNQPRK
jgi:hypothetical protein